MEKLKINRLFVYGTLYLPPQNKAIIKGYMYDFGPFPGVIPDPSGYDIEGGIIILRSEKHLIEFDRFESIPSLYTREIITVNDKETYIYVPSKKLMEAKDKIEIIPKIVWEYYRINRDNEKINNQNTLKIIH